eukprot:jgi/Chlat1/7396/Chrsp6S07427
MSSSAGLRRRCASAPAGLDRLGLVTSTAEEGLDVYAAIRPLRDFGGRLYAALPCHVKAALRDLGVCHYMAIVQTPQGQIIQFDFGPTGGDIAKTHLFSRLRRAQSHSLGAMASIGTDMTSMRPRRRKAKPGEVRETVLDSLPETCMLIGRTPMSLEEIRTFNSAQDLYYELNNNDCRHYVNNLCRYTLGVDKAHKSAIRAIVLERRMRPQPTPTDRLWHIGQLIFEPETLQLLSRASNAAVAYFAGSAGLRLIQKSMSVQQSVAPVRAMMAVATAAATSQKDRPLVRGVVNLGGKLSSKVTTAAVLPFVTAGHATRFTAYTAKSTFQYCVGAATVATAVTATCKAALLSKGAAALMTCQQHAGKLLTRAARERVARERLQAGRAATDMAKLPSPPKSSKLTLARPNNRLPVLCAPL